MSFIKMYIKQN